MIDDYTDVMGRDSVADGEWYVDDGTVAGDGLIALMMRDDDPDDAENYRDKWFFDELCWPDSQRPFFASIARDHNRALRERWIPVGERLPEAWYSVMLSYPDAVSQGFMTPGGRFMLHPFKSTLEVTHWRPLPEPPKGET